jgi:2-polyprenyl-3-methyl-5-hydroxy-6-metoxy-1,4-benzoquinol methylase
MADAYGRKPNSYFSSERQEILSFVPARRTRVLEVGCGEGRFVGALTGVQESWGIEPSSAAIVAKDLLTRVLQCGFDEGEAHLPHRYFDLVICNDVIEHLPDYSSFLSRITKYIAPGGMMIGSIPNVRFYKNMLEYLLEKDWAYVDFGVLDRTHLAFFTPKSFRRALQEHGFKVVRLKGINADIRYSNSPRAWVYLITAYFLIAVTLGYFSDIRYQQFAFQATPPEP